ncbi:MAG: deoxyribonuclease IV, partial [Epsilonproteobacteria bacterium]|nr:deoxyribonuclease IV [Campylobacterota bacterium]
AAGYDIRNKKSYNETMSRFRNIVGSRYLKAFHINDSKTKFASRIDRHANIGEGFIGTDAFGFLLNDSHLTVLPMILETPGGINAYKKDLEILSGLFQDSSYM